MKFGAKQKFFFFSLTSEIGVMKTVMCTFTKRDTELFQLERFHRAQHHDTSEKQLSCPALMHVESSLYLVKLFA